MLLYNNDESMCLEELPGSTIEETSLNKDMVKKMFSFGVRVNVNIEGQLEY